MTVVLALVVGGGVASAGLPTPPVPALPAPPLSDDVFYVPPSPLPDGKPGDVIRTRDVPLSSYPDARVQQIMYLSTDIHDKLVPVTGMLLTPLLQKPGNDNPLVVHTPGTRGLDDRCAPSKQANPLQANPGSPEYAMPEYQQLLARGISVVVTDYEGQGTPGDPSYLVGQSEGRNGLDALRAAEHIKGSGVSPDSPVGISGYSQGGQAAAWAAELQPTYAPEQHLKAVLAGGTPTDMLLEVNHLNGNPTAGAGFALASLVGLNHGKPELDLDSKLTPEGKQILDQVKQSCVVELFAGFGTTTVGQVTNPDVLSDPAWQNAYRASQLGTKKPGAPAYLYHGTADNIVPIAQAEMLYHDWCTQGASVQYETIPATEHISANILGSQRGVQWLADRVEGAQTIAGCHEVDLS
ncbi:lipase family protein [Saccharopolyspora mangrovi]|uniref:Lipase family protein n=1 Tax=Saccharopolyspora mangrovi TaxID=3082379 RepID=A0ABU6AII1_9PSEU|nr:lipase family protein [Saccharopolyspora sp. S2-29]MEB3371330.1 lipase family protein [Saccharopolyspora sp. S2-29]